MGSNDFKGLDFTSCGEGARRATNDGPSIDPAVRTLKVVPNVFSPAVISSNQKAAETTRPVIVEESSC